MEPKYIRLPQEIASFISRFENSSDYFPSHDRRIGLSIRAGYHPDYQQTMVEICEERPSFVSTTNGEYTTPSEADENIRSRARNLASYCEIIAQELLEHKERLLKIANTQGDILDLSDLNTNEYENVHSMHSVFESENSPRNNSALRSAPKSVSRVSLPSNGTKRTKAPLDLGLFVED